MIDLIADLRLRVFSASGEHFISSAFLPIVTTHTPSAYALNLLSPSSSDRSSHNSNQPLTNDAVEAKFDKDECRRLIKEINQVSSAGKSRQGGMLDIPN